MHGSDCCQPDVPQRYDPCNPSSSGGKTKSPKVMNASHHLHAWLNISLCCWAWMFLLICFCWNKTFREIIRRKAVLALYKFYLIAPNQVQHIHNKFRKALCDKDPGVMTASLHIYLQMIQVVTGFLIMCSTLLKCTYACIYFFFFHFKTGEPRSLQGPDAKFCHHIEAGGGRKAAHGF